MKFIPSEQNKNYKVFDETGFYRSTVDNITEYFLEYDRMLRQFSLTDIERDVWILAMNYDFISYVAQKFCYYNEKGKTSQDGRTILTEVIRWNQILSFFLSFTVQFFPLSKGKEALKIMSKCNNTFYGLVKAGVYVYARAGSKK